MFLKRRMMWSPILKPFNHRVAICPAVHRVITAGVPSLHHRVLAVKTGFSGPIVKAHCQQEMSA